VLLEGAGRPECPTKSDFYSKGVWQSIAGKDYLSSYADPALYAPRVSQVKALCIISAEIKKER
jgi:hypothetical protein